MRRRDVLLAALVVGGAIFSPLIIALAVAALLVLCGMR